MMMSYDWDPDKEKINIEQHGYSFVHASSCFNDPEGFFVEDMAHSAQEPRWYWLGKDIHGTILVVRYTVRGNKIRIFGCANWRKFRKIYNERTKSKKSEV
jgi:uncharacterized DUF497 family protein